MTHTASRNIYLFQSFSFFSGFCSNALKITIPYMVYMQTQSVLFTATQLTLSILGTFLASMLIRSVNFKYSDKNIISLSELTMAASVFFISLDSQIGIFSLYVLTIVESFISTIKSGHTESFIGFYCKEYGSTRQHIIGKIRVFINIGSLVGLGVSIPILNLLGKDEFFYLILILYLFSSLFAWGIQSKANKQLTKTKTKPDLSLLFSDKFINLTLSHGLMSVSLNIFNGTVVFVLLNYLDSGQLGVTQFYLLSSLAAILGSTLLLIKTKTKKIDFSYAVNFRVFYFLLFFMSIFTDSYLYYISVFSILNCLHSFCIGLWQDMFQSISSDNEWKLVGATRKTLVSVSGIIGSLIGGICFNEFGYVATYSTASLFSLLSVFFIARHLKENQIEVKEQS